MAQHPKIKEVFLDRDEQRNDFLSILQGESPQHILLIQAGGGMGKTRLLEEFWSLSSSHPRARINLKGNSYSLDNILFRLCESLGREQFVSYYNICSDIFEGFRPILFEERQERKIVLEVLNNTFNDADLRQLVYDLALDYENLAGENKSARALDLVQYMDNRGRFQELFQRVVQLRPYRFRGDLPAGLRPRRFSLLVWGGTEKKLEDMPRKERSHHRQRLMTAFFEDLEILLKDSQKRAVILIDTYEQGQREIQNWLSGDFLRMARLIPGLVVVIAGRQIPNLESEVKEWCLSHSLQALTQAHVQEFVERLRLSTDDLIISINQIHQISEGAPQRVAQILETHLKMAEGAS